MRLDTEYLSAEERASLRLRALYRQRGFTQYKMSKFEEYDLYVRSKDFLISNQVITFTDLTGKLMALKPDVTLSILKNTQPRPEAVQKVFYDEQVYRIPRAASTYKEIRQVGLECIGPIDSYCCFEVLSLAAASLKEISPRCVLGISDMAILTGLLARAGLSQRGKKQVLRCFAEKNAHELGQICTGEGVSSQDIALLQWLSGVDGSPSQVLPLLRQRLGGDSALLDRLDTLTSALTSAGWGEMIRIDFSVSSSMTYYDGIVFRGFVDGLASGILSGGQYSKLTREMGLDTDAIGFAVYLDLLEQLPDSTQPLDADLLLLYDEGTDLTALDRMVNRLNRQGKRVAALRRAPDTLRYGKAVNFNELEAELG